MSDLKYQKKSSEDEEYYVSQIYKVKSFYQHEQLREPFIHLKANVVDLNPATVTKCIQGTEQDFIMLMKKAKDFLNSSNIQVNEKGKAALLELFQDCVFGYYILTPLIKDKKVSDIKVLSWNKITCKVNGDRYLTNLSFENEDDYNKWYERIFRIHNLQLSPDAALQHCTDRKGVANFYLRIDTQLDSIISTEDNNIHIRKIPKEKLSWDYLKENNMLDDDMIEYLKDRIVSGYGFLISGRGGSGKSTLLNNMIDLIPYDQSVLVSQMNCILKYILRFNLNILWIFFMRMVLIKK